MNAGKSKVMVGCSGEKMIVNSGKWPCGVCGKGGYVCDVLYAVLYVRVSCFVVRGCAVSRRYINVCNCDILVLLMCTLTI